MKNLIFTMFFLLTVGLSFGQNKKVKTIEFETVGYCASCTDNIMYALDAKGIKFASYDLKTQKTKVIYKTKKIDEAGIHKLVNMAGYDTERSKADQKAKDALPICCKKEGQCDDALEKEDHKDCDHDHDHDEDDDHDHDHK